MTCDSVPPGKFFQWRKVLWGVIVGVRKAVRFRVRVRPSPATGTLAMLYTGRQPFQEERATQMAALIAQHCGGRISHMKLIKLMYLVERLALVRFGRRITHDWLFSMQNGPVLSATLDRINEVEPPTESERTYWQRYFTPRENHHISLRGEVPSGALSRADRELISEVLTDFGHMSQWDLRDWCHANLPEWKDPGTSRERIDPKLILLSEGYSEEDASEVLGDVDAEAFARALLG